jgi:hypothetical protein
MFRPINTSALLVFGLVIGSVGIMRLVADQLPCQAITDPEAQLKAIAKEWNEARAKQKDKPPKFEPYAERCFQLVEAFPRSSTAMRALVLVATHARDTPQANARAIELLKARVGEVDLEYLGKHLGWTFPYGMSDLAPLVFTKAKAQPGDRYAPSMVVWVCLASGHGDSKGLFRDALEYLVEHYGDSKSPWSVLQYVDLTRQPDTAWSEQQVRAILAVNKNDQVRRLAAYTLGALLAGQSEATQADAEKWIRECLKISQGMKEKKVDDTEQKAQLLLTKIQRFGIGKVAPDIVGQDLDGQPLKLSDYRGKVLLLDFWGFW